MSSSQNILPVAVLGFVLTASAAGAGTVTVTRCNTLIDGVFRPVLIVERDGIRTEHRLGEDGLTRSIAFTPKAALAWVAEVYGTKGNVYRDCGTPGVERGDTLAVTPPVPDEGGECGGGDCGGGDCGGGDCGGGDCGGGDCGGGDCGGGEVNGT